MMRVESTHRNDLRDHLMTITKPTSPLVSVAMPTFNRPEYLRRAIEGVVAQTYTNLEILIGDNGNSAKTREVVESFNDPRITYIGREQNLGMALNVLSLCKQGSGEYFCILADDDFWGEDFIAKLVEPLEQHPGVAMGFSDFFVVDGSSDVQPEATELTTQEWGRDQLEPGVHAPAFEIGLVKRSIPLVASLFRRKAINLDKFVIDTGNTYDLWLFYLALENGGGAYYQNERLMYCRVHTGQDSMNQHVALDLNTSLCYDRFLEDPRLKALYPVLRDQIVLRRTRAGTQMLHLGRSHEARTQLLIALRKRFAPRAAIGLLLSYFPGKTASKFANHLRGVLAVTRRITKAETRIKHEGHQG
jgi:glycosyltransferase involved in cell wall biosynthesis